ncbi:MAG: methionyl-tRNA formyltransferase [Cryomorphaceae bacterium]|nr:methionyl-tRNA formyltransferase [Cryomorphaceae bacterium]
MTAEERKNYRIIFMGTPDFAVASLEALHSAGFTISAVLTTPPKASGRGLKTRKCAVHLAAERLGIPVIAPEKLNSPEAIEKVKQYEADLGVVVAFKKLPEDIYTHPKMGTFNLHASLLPDYRGAAPINRAIMNGETKSGVTTFILNDKIDEGAIFLQREMEIGINETASELHDRMMDLGADLVVKTADGYLAGEISPVTQKNDSEKKAPKIFREDCRINWTWTAIEIHNHIRGLSGFPGAFSYMTLPRAQEIKILRSEWLGECENSGEKITHKRTKKWIVEKKNAAFEILEVQPQGKKRMFVREFLNGLPEGDINIE